MKELGTIIDALLGQLPDGDIYEQFISCNVAGIRLVELPKGDHGHLWLDLSKLRDPPKEMIYIIELQRTDNIDQWFITIGHELCHIFESYQNAIPQILPYHIAKCFYAYYGGRPISDGWIDWLEAFEAFCDMFSRKWLNYRNNRAEVVELLNLLRERQEIFFGRPLE